MRQTLAKVACIISFFACGADAIGQNVPLKVGINYTQARTALIDNGWQPFLPAGANLLACGDENPCNNRSINYPC